MIARPRSAFRLTGASVLALAALTVAALAEQGPESAAENYQLFHSHAAWRAPAVIASGGAQAGATWTISSSHVNRSNDTVWLPIMPPGETVNVEGRVDRGNGFVDLRP